jgi:hypothetical protein
MTLGLRWVMERRCNRADPHLAAAARLLPAASAPGDLASRCRLREKAQLPFRPAGDPPPK